MSGAKAGIHNASIIKINTGFNLLSDSEGSLTRWYVPMQKEVQDLTFSKCRGFVFIGQERLLMHGRTVVRTRVMDVNLKGTRRCQRSTRCLCHLMLHGHMSNPSIIFHVFNAKLISVSDLITSTTLLSPHVSALWTDKAINISHEAIASCRCDWTSFLCPDGMVAAYASF